MRQASPTLRSVCERLERLIDYEKHPPMAPSTRVFHLEEFRAFLARLGNPQRDFRIVHVAGTRGKGTVATILAEALHHRGHRVGLYRSPHVDNLRERIVTNGRWISPKSFVKQCSLALDVHEQSARSPDETFRTYFEILTATAFLQFRSERVDWAVIETGLGGRLDATNVVEPDLTIITAIGVDHVRVLGSDPVGIAKEKAGILKRGVPCVLGPQPRGQRREVRGAIIERAKRLGCEVIDAKRRWSVDDVEITPSGLRASMNPARGKPESCRVALPHPSLGGIPALITAWAALEKMGLPTAISKTPETFSWMNLGRFEVVTKRPLSVLDGAHCPLSAKNLRENIARMPAAPRRFCLSMMGDKDHLGFLKALELHPNDVIALPRMGTPRQLPPGELAALVKRLAPECAVQVFPSVRSAIRWLGSQRPRGTIVVTGSFYHLSSARRALRDLSE